MLVAADKGSRKPAQGIVRQLSQTESAYQEARRLLRNRGVERFTTVSGGLGLVPDASSSLVARWLGLGLIWVTGLGQVFSTAMIWILGVAGGLGVLRLLLLALFARAHVRRLERFRTGAPWMRETSGPVTVLVPAYNEQAGIGSTLRSLLDSTHRELQSVVIDDGSTDRTADIAASVGDARVEVVRQAISGKAGALNTGLARARYGIVVMVDAYSGFASATGRPVAVLTARSRRNGGGALAILGSGSRCVTCAGGRMDLALRGIGRGSPGLARGVESWRRQPRGDMRRGLIEEYGAGPSCPPVDPAVLHRVEQTLGHPLPADLSTLLLQTDGIEGPYGEGIVWPAEQILENNRTFRTDPEIRLLYRPFDSLLFIGDNGGGDQFALLWAFERASVHVWDHETDERGAVAPDLAGYVRRALGSGGEDWYR
ncbi:glycosyltransferase [Streptomyces massasporeus]|uniref:glycosyltransferase n=1 Tax=Streptomyces massasporeus TaxID=67324 RepID=UPI0036F62003